jgi:hypothetical protein
MSPFAHDLQVLVDRDQTESHSVLPCCTRGGGASSCSMAPSRIAPDYSWPCPFLFEILVNEIGGVVRARKLAHEIEEPREGLVGFRHRTRRVFERVDGGPMTMLRPMVKSAWCRNRLASLSGEPSPFGTPIEK